MKTKLSVLASFLLVLGLLSLMAGCDRKEQIVTAPLENIDHGVVVDDSVDLNISAEEVNAAGRIAFERANQDKSMVAVYLNVPYFSQLDPTWRNVGLGFNHQGCNSTIGRYGCHLTCLAMLYKKWGYSSMTPVVLNNWSYGGRAHYAFSTSECGDLIRLPEALKYNGSGITNRSSRAIANKSLVLAELIAGRPVVARISYTSGTTFVPSHYLVIYAFDGINYLVRDPLGQSSRVLYGNIRSLAVYGS